MQHASPRAAFEEFVQLFYRLFSTPEPNRPHTKGLGGFDVVLEIIDENGSRSGQIELFENGEINAGVGFHHTHFCGDENPVECVADLPFVKQGGAGIGHGIGEGNRLVTRPQALDVVEKLAVEHVAREEGGASGFEFVRAQVQRHADVFPMIGSGDVPPLSRVSAFPIEEDFFEVGNGHAEGVCEHLARAAVFSADQHPTEVEDNGLDENGGGVGHRRMIHDVMRLGKQDDYITNPEVAIR